MKKMNSGKKLILVLIIFPLLSILFLSNPSSAGLNDAQVGLMPMQSIIEPTPVVQETPDIENNYFYKLQPQHTTTWVCCFCGDTPYPNQNRLQAYHIYIPDLTDFSWGSYVGMEYSFKIRMGQHYSHHQGIMFYVRVYSGRLSLKVYKTDMSWVIQSTLYDNYDYFDTIPDSIDIIAQIRVGENKFSAHDNSMLSVKAYINDELEPQIDYVVAMDCFNTQAKANDGTIHMIQLDSKTIENQYLDNNEYLGYYYYTPETYYRFLNSIDYATMYDSFINFPLFANVKDLLIESQSLEFEDYDFWEYNAINIVFDDYEVLDVGIYTEHNALYNDSLVITYDEWEFDYAILTTEATASRFYYTLIYDTKTWGDWGVFNFLQEALIYIINLLIYVANFLLFLLVLAFNYILIYFLLGIVVGFLWNIPLKYLLWCVLWLLWFVCLFLLVIWEFLIWIIWALWNLLLFLWNNVIVPFFAWFIEWFFVDFFPILIDIIILIIAVIISFFIWILTLGTSDYFVILDTVYEMLAYVTDFFINSFTFFLTNLVSFMIYFVWYIINIGLLFGTYYIAKTKGYVNRSESLYESFEGFYLPIQYAYILLIKIKNVIPMI